MIAYIVSEKNKYYFREYDGVLFISDLYEVCLIQVDHKVMITEDIEDVIKKAVIFQITPEKIPVALLNETIRKKTKTTDDIVFQKILYKNSIYWINAENLIHINHTFLPSKIKSLNNHLSRK